MQRQHLDTYRHSAPPVLLLQMDPNGPFKKADAADAGELGILSQKPWLSESWRLL